MRSLALLLFAAAAAFAGETEVMIHVPVNPRIDMSKYDSILVMNFVTSGSSYEKFDVNQETVKFLRNELKARSTVKVLDPMEAPIVEGAADTVFQDASYWQHVGALYPGALIVSGRLGLKVEQRSGFTTEEVISPTTGLPVRVQRFKEGRYFVLEMDAYFIEGSTGTPVLQETFREELLHDNPDQPALYGYYDLMDRILPRFLSAVISQKYVETRYLLD
ncbi:MAG: hypothetical protein AB1714_03075 [Acidobacteriota bacterium]